MKTKRCVCYYEDPRGVFINFGEQRGDSVNSTVYFQKYG